MALTRDPGALFSRGGLVWYGGFLGGVIAVLIAGMRHKVPVRWTMQLVGPALAASYAVGRVGCFLIGDDYGGPSTLPWAVKFPDGLPPSTVASLQAVRRASAGGPGPEHGARRAPDADLRDAHHARGVRVALVEAERAGRHRLDLRGLPDVRGAERFLVEILRAKDDRFVGPLTIAQVTSIGVLVAGAIVYAKLKPAAAVEPGGYLAGTTST